MDKNDISEVFIRHARRYDLVAKGDRILIAHSGGGDSTFLFQMLIQTREALGIELVAAHINHGLRENASGDEEFVRKACDEKKVPFHSRTVDVTSVVETGNISTEMAARRLRYQALEEIAIETGCTKAAFAHHADDRVETFLLRLMKGSGPDGLRSIPRTRKMGRITLIRPLLDITKAQIVEWLDSNGIPYITDETNFDTDIPRNAVRHELLPLIREKFNPSVNEAIIRTIEALDSDGLFFDRRIADEADQRIADTGSGKILILSELAQTDIPVIIRLLIEAFTRVAGHDYRPAYEHLMCAAELWISGQDGKMIEFPAGWLVIRDSEGLLIQRERPSIPQPPDSAPIELVAGENRIGDTYIVTLKILDGSEIESLKQPPPGGVYMNGKIEKRISADFLGEGKKFQPMGMTGHRKKITDILMEHEIPSARRPWVPVIVMTADPNEVLAIPHLGLVAEGAKVEDPEGTVLELRLSPKVDMRISGKGKKSGIMDVQY